MLKNHLIQIYMTVGEKPKEFIGALSYSSGSTHFTILCQDGMVVHLRCIDVVQIVDNPPKDSK